MDAMQYGRVMLEPVSDALNVERYFRIFCLVLVAGGVKGFKASVANGTDGGWVVCGAAAGAVEIDSIWIELGVVVKEF